MSRFVKFSVVLAGYTAAALAAGAALEIRLLNTQGPDVDASAGMYAFGDVMLFLAVFAFAALFPTGLALYLLRACRWIWTALAIAAPAIAVTGALAAAIYVLAACQALPPQSPLMIWAGLAVLRMLAAPPLAAAFVLSALIAPNRTSRWSLLAAAAIEGAVAAYAFLHWFAGCCI